MKNIHRIVAALTLSCSIVSTGWSIAPATINFGSRDSGFVASQGTLALGTITLTDGSLRDLGGSITGTVTASGLTIETKDGTTARKMTTDGTVVIGTSIALSDNQVLTAHGGSFTEDVTIEADAAAPAIIQGFGSFDAVITVNDGKKLNMRWNGILNQNIDLNASNGTTSTLKLEQDLQFGVGKFITATDTSGATDLVDFNGYKILAGGDESTLTSIANAQSWANPNLSLCGPVQISASKTITITSPGLIAGNGHRLLFNTGSVLANGGNAVTFDDIILSSLTSSSLAGAGDWTFVNSRLEGSSSSFEIDGSITSSTVDVFAGGVTFGASTLRLLNDITPGGTWTLAGDLTINGQGNVFNCGGSGKRVTLASYALHLTDITLAKVADVSIDANTVSGSTLYLSNVNWLSASGNALHIMGASSATTSTPGAAQLGLPQNQSAGNIFGTNISWLNGINAELLSDVTLGECTWSFNGDSDVDGRGCHLDLSQGAIKVKGGKTLTLRNIVLDNVTSNSFFSGDGFNGTLNLSNVTIILNDVDVTWAGKVVVDGPLTVVTGSHTFTGSDMTLHGVTAYYDTLSTTNSSNLVVSTPSTGRVMYIDAAVIPATTGTLSITENSNLSSNMYLYPTDGDIAGRVISCTDTATLNGHGRSIVFPYTDGFDGSTAVLSVSTSKTLTTTNVVLEGLVPSQHVSGSGTLLFGDNTTIRLHEDIALTTTVTFGSSGTADSETMVLDLAGHAIDMSSVSAAIVLQGQTGVGAPNTLRIKNGRIINLSGTKLAAEQATLLVFENVEFSLSGDTTWANAALSIEGNCVISGLLGSIFTNTSTADFTITAGSHLKIVDGIIYSHNNGGTINFVMPDSSAKLELIGATFRHPDLAGFELTLSGGTLILDHKSYIQPGSAGMAIASSLTIEVRPGATLNVTTGTGASSGTVTFS